MVLLPHFVRTQQEAARYLETYKAYEQKSAESIQEKVGHKPIEKIICQNHLTTLGAVQRADKFD